MTTIYDSPAGPAEVTQEVLVYDVLSNVRQDHWSPQGWWERTKWNLLKFGALLCCNSGAVEAVEYEIRVRNDVRRAMMSTLSPRGESIPAAAAFEVFATTGYDMMGFRKTHQEERLAAIEEARQRLADARPEPPRALNGQLAIELPQHDEFEFDEQGNIREPEEAQAERENTMIQEVWEARCVEEGLVPNFAELPTTRKVCVVPRFVAAMTLVLRAKRGRLPFNEANRLVIERDYNRYCREGNVRYADIVHHSQWVYNTYFGEGVYDEIPTTRVRVPAWMRALIPQPVVSAPTVC